LERGLTLDEVVEHTLAGFREGEVAAAERGHPIVVTCLLTAMRHAARSREIAELTVRFRDRGVGGFDIAGAEAGYPPSRHLDAFEYMRANSAHFTIHAGEAFGLPSIHEALAFCGCDRLGHGVRITDDISVPGAVEDAELGLVANYVRDMRIPLELCPSSNVQTGAVPSLDKHPFDLLARLRFRVTVNTDNRLMSDTSMSQEMLKLVETFGYGSRRSSRSPSGCGSSTTSSSPDTRCSSARGGTRPTGTRQRRLRGSAPARLPFASVAIWRPCAYPAVQRTTRLRKRWLRGRSARRPARRADGHRHPAQPTAAGEAPRRAGRTALRR
jgi:hypothetical protein